MTRINVVPPAELCDKHLLAEYRELPRVYNLAIAWHYRGGNVDDLPAVYCLGKGHVSFFYDKLMWCFNRHFHLYGECLARHFNVTMDNDRNRRTFALIPDELFNDYSPTPHAIRINRQRISERLGTMKNTSNSRL
jgi:deoxyribonuclease (pyrimidine dimer)